MLNTNNGINITNIEILYYRIAVIVVLKIMYHPSNVHQ